MQHSPKRRVLRSHPQAYDFTIGAVDFVPVHVAVGIDDAADGRSIQQSRPTAARTDRNRNGIRNLIEPIVGRQAQYIDPRKAERRGGIHGIGIGERYIARSGFLGPLGCQNHIRRLPVVRYRSIQNGAVGTHNGLVGSGVHDRRGVRHYSDHQVIGR